MLKKILITFTATAGALALAADLFLNSILGAFGLAATSVETLSKLQATPRSRTEDEEPPTPQTEANQQAVREAFG